MLVSHDHKFILLKPGKTAGTSVEIFLEPLCAPEGHKPVHIIKHALETEHGIVAARAPNAEGNNKFYNHIWARDLKEILPEDVWSGYVKVATVRNPYDRAISLFNHFVLSQRSAGRFTKDEIIDKFRQWAASERAIWFRASKVIVIDDVSCLDRQIRYERLREDLTDFCAAIDVDIETLGPIPAFKTDKRIKTISLPEYYDEATVEVIREKAKPDFELLGYSESFEDAVDMAGERQLVA
ncbi:MAG: sulfotransferase family 2 domain-containing protein [Devosia sp.]